MSNQWTPSKINNSMIISEEKYHRIMTRLVYPRTMFDGLPPNCYISKYLLPGSKQALSSLISSKGKKICILIMGYKNNRGYDIALGSVTGKPTIKECKNNLLFTAVKREIFEETGILVDKIIPLCINDGKQIRIRHKRYDCLHFSVDFSSPKFTFTHDIFEKRTIGSPDVKNCRINAWIYGKRESFVNYFKNSIHIPNDKIEFYSCVKATTLLKLMDQMKEDIIHGNKRLIKILA